MNEHIINSLNNFICGYYIDGDVCDKLIDYHQTSDKKFPGEVGDKEVDPSTKQSTDVEFGFNQAPELANLYSQNLQLCVNEYLKKYPAAGRSNWTINERVNIQHYKPTEGYHAWHCERVDKSYPNVARHLVFMTYLNDVTDGGETEFLHQNIKIKPQKGLTLIWPADWTFTHRGVPSNSQDKYIITGWFSFS
jgi:prolyl 4-hydroxylase